MNDDLTGRWVSCPNHANRIGNYRVGKITGQSIIYHDNVPYLLLTISDEIGEFQELANQCCAYYPAEA